MSELPEERINAAARSDWLLLEYDYFKHLSTIGLVTIGAILSFVQGSKHGSATLVLVGLSLVSISAASSFGSMNHIISHRKTGRSLRFLYRWERMIASISFAAGLGMFVSEIGRVTQ